MQTKTLPKSAKNLLKFLNTPFIQEFFDDNREPDIYAARVFKDKFLEIHNDYKELFTIEQSYNKITVKKVL